MSQTTTTIKPDSISAISNHHASAVHQINRTIAFELKRNVKKFYNACLVNTIFVVLFYLINFLLDRNAEEASGYITSYLGMISYLVLIIAITFGGSMIVEDFEKHTGNLLFPKIERGRLLVGRYAARFFYASLSLGVYYLEIAIITSLNYDSLPVEMWYSYGWSLLYLNLVLSFTVLMSALSKRIATASIMTMLFFLMVFTIINTILMYTESTVEPLFIINYYSNIITACFNMPENRYSEINFGPRGSNERVFLQWATPSVEGALIGMILYSAVLLIGAYLIYRTKQAKD